MARAGHVYVMRVSDEAVKVGFSKNPARRAIELGTLDVLHHTEWLEHAELIEKSAHRLLKLGKKHIKDEIFSASVKEAIAAINDAIEMAAGETLRLDSTPVGNNKWLQVRVDEEFERKLDRLRKAEPDLPSKSEMVNRLVDRANEKLDSKK